MDDGPAQERKAARVAVEAVASAARRLLDGDLSVLSARMPLKRLLAGG